MRIIYILVGFVFLFTGCSATLPNIVKYKVSPKLTIQKQHASMCSTKSVKVASAFTDSSLMSKDMRYVKGDSKVYQYSESAWLNTPNRALSKEFIKMLRGLNMYKSVQGSKSRSRADQIVEIDLEEFMQYYSEDLKNSYALVVVHLAVVDFQSSKVIATSRFRSKVDVKTLDAKGGVIGLEKALENILSQSAKWFTRVCR